ncbi:PREDICTED: olfactory receptor 10AG1-like [Nanorana parkeri]|uniref:olfactory receptor 10AG1-like n=1 Tax=Nanorana parkeri TaxID=125878 RepID=UPI0008540BC8|nr:PREDICTED: olfactory receptor 10AG1-like [Nanorana parkeri]
MSITNSTTITNFILVGFRGLTNFRFLLFSAFLVIYMIILAGNVLTIVLVLVTPSLRSSMYFFLCNLSISDILYCTGIVPNMLDVVLKDGGSITLTACLTQFQIYGESMAVSAILLGMMSYDRYIAICKPLHYSLIMNKRLQYQLALFSWWSGFLITLNFAIRISQLAFCDSNVIDYYFCDFYPLLDLSCSEVLVLEIHSNIFSFVLVSVPFFFICVTYVCIILSILKISSVSGRQKAFYTCSSHLSIVCLFYGSLTVVYLSSAKNYSLNRNKALSLLNTMGMPLLNPIIYSLRNAEIQTALRRLGLRCCQALRGLLATRNLKFKLKKL